jgi:hypothetical protein
MQLWKVNIRIQQFIALKAMTVGNRLFMWGTTHYPIVILDEVEEQNAYAKA